MTIIIPCSLGSGYCMFGFLIFTIDKRNFLYCSLYILTEQSLKHICSIRAWVPVSFFLSLSLSLSFWLIPWSTETHLAHSPAQASKTLSRRHPVPSRPPREVALCLCERRKSCVKDSAETREYQPLSLFHFSYCYLRTARSQSIKRPQ